jgi:two-component system chemotaxis response regulator CheY
MNSLANLNVLLVDDIPAVRDILSQMLFNLGVGGRIDEAGDGQEAWDLLQNHTYDVVICDIYMPRVDGLELRQRIRTSPHYKNLPFLLITGEVPEGKMDCATATNADGYLHKPFQSTLLKNRLLKVLGKV